MPHYTKTNRLFYFISLIKQALKGGEYDYTSGSIRVAIVLLAVPMILELSLESLFAVVDMFIVGKLGSNAIQAVGLTESVITIVYTIAIGLSTGATALVARRVGEKKPDEASHAGAQSIVITLAIAALLTLGGVLFPGEILKLMKADPQVVAEGETFTRIMFAGSGAIMFLFVINGIFRGAGDAAIAMRSLWIASGINIILCPLLVRGYGPFPELGLQGAAIATTIGRSAGVLYQCYALFGKKGVITLKKSHFKWDWPVSKSLLGISWPAIFQFFMASGSWIILTRLVAETGGKDASAGYQIAIRNVVFFILPAWGLSNAAATLVGQNLGAKQPDRAEKSVLLTMKYNAVFMSFVMLLFLFFARPIINIFNSNPVVVQYGAQALQIIGSGYIFYGIGMVMIQALNGAGDTKTPTWINFAGFWLFQIPFAYLLAHGFAMGPEGAFIAIPVAETLIALAAYYYFKKGKWKEVEV
ncbi:MAG: MATE family efflux transporter [Bacteroidota bacterium]